MPTVTVAGAKLDYRLIDGRGPTLVFLHEGLGSQGLWREAPSPAPFPIGHKHEEYLSGMRAMRRWKDHFSIKREFSRAKSIL